MSKTVKLFELPASPNNKKVRIALNYKEIPFEQVLVEFQPGVPIHRQDRSKVVAASRQPLTPVLQHGDAVIFDSGAILRYLEANFPNSRPLFVKDYAGMKTIEEWEWYARGPLTQPVGIIFGQAFAEKPDGKECERASKLMHDLTAKTEARLAESPWIAGESMTAADVTAAPFLHYATLPPEAAQAGPVSAFFEKHLKLGEGRDKTREWVRRVMAYDR